MATVPAGLRNLLTLDATTSLCNKPKPKLEGPSHVPAQLQSVQAVLNRLKSCLICSICNSPLVEPNSLRCGHSFCFECAHRVLLTSPQCPDKLCNVTTSANDLRPVIALKECVDTLVHSTTSPPILSDAKPHRFRAPLRKQKSVNDIKAVLLLHSLKSTKTRRRDSVPRGKENQSFAAPLPNNIHDAKQRSFDSPFTGVVPGRNRGRNLTNLFRKRPALRPPEQTIAPFNGLESPSTKPVAVPMENSMTILADMAFARQQAAAGRTHDPPMSMKPEHVISKDEKHKKSVRASRYRKNEGFRKLKAAMEKAKPELKLKRRADTIDEATSYILATHAHASGNGTAQQAAYSMKPRKSTTRIKLKPLTEDEKQRRHVVAMRMCRQKISDGLKRLEDALLTTNRNLILHHHADVLNQAVIYVHNAHACAGQSCGLPAGL